MAYFDLQSNQGYLAAYKVGLTGETNVIITPAVKTIIENTVDAYINGRFKRTFTGNVPPMIEEIAGELSLWQIIARVTPGNDPSNERDREAAWSYKANADELIKMVFAGDLALYKTDGSSIVITTKEGKLNKIGDSTDNHVFQQQSQPMDWPSREDVYNNE